jgi:hypothetical protein
MNVLPHPSHSESAAQIAPRTGLLFVGSRLSRQLRPVADVLATACRNKKFPPRQGALPKLRDNAAAHPDLARWPAYT